MLLDHPDRTLAHLRGKPTWTSHRPHPPKKWGLSETRCDSLGSVSINYADRAFWSDVLTSPFHGFTDSYTLVNASFGYKWAQRRLTTLIKITNLLNQDIQQHVFGDILKANVSFEARFRF
jgi:hypothetical protein